MDPADSGKILTPRMTSGFGRAGGVLVLVNAGVILLLTKKHTVTAGIAGRFGGGGSDPSRIWHSGLCDFDAANSHFEDYQYRMGGESASSSTDEIRVLSEELTQYQTL